jgi:phosphatidylglycerophosphate synthase
MISKLIDRLLSPVRDGLARALVSAGLRPNHVTVLGMLLTVGAGVAIALGPGFWRTWALGLLVAAGAADLLDGAMAKRGSLKTPFGGLLDSTCDRIGDAALFLGTAFHFLVPDEADPAARANLTLGLLAGLGLLWAYLVSYVRARADEACAQAHGGFWQRPERLVTLLLGLAFHHMTIATWVLGIWPATTVAHRLWRAARTCPAAPGGPPRPAPDLGPPGLAGVVLWRWRRGTIPFDIQAGMVVALCVFVDLPAADPLREALARWVGA